MLIQLRVGGQAARLRDETFPLACGCIGQETTGAGGFAKALRTVPVVLDIAAARARAGRAGRVDRRLHQPRRHRHPRAAGRRPPRHRAVQRRDRLPAGVRARMLGVAPERVARRPGRAQPPDLGARGVARRARRAARAARATTATSSPSGVGLPRRAARRARRGALLLPALLLRPRRGARRAARGATPRAAAVAEIEPSCSSCTRDPALTTSRRCSSSAAARSTARRRRALLASLVAGDGGVHVVDVRNDGALAGLADDDVVEMPARVGRARARAAAQPPARARAARARRSTSRPTSGWRPRRRSARDPADVAPRRCSPTRWSASGRGRTSCCEALLARRGGATVTARSSSPSTAATRRPTSRWSRDDGARARAGARAR